MSRLLHRFDVAAVSFVRSQALVMLRVSLAVVYVWFGALKILGVSPVADLVARTLSFLPARPANELLGVLEVLLGVALLTGWAVRVTTVVFVGHMAGTFSVVLLAPDLIVQHGNPLILTTLGEFVTKNLVLLAAGLTIAAASPAWSVGDTLRRLLLSAASRRAGIAILAAEKEPATEGWIS